MSGYYCNSLYYVGDSRRPTYSASDESVKPNLRTLLEELLSKVAQAWENIGILLGIEIGQLDRIKSDNANESNACLREMLKIWLKRVDTPPSWSEIANTLNTLGNEVVASQIRAKYIN